jgi:hypothetical protein
VAVVLYTRDKVKNKTVYESWLLTQDDEKSTKLLMHFNGLSYAYQGACMQPKEAPRPLKLFTPTAPLVPAVATANSRTLVDRNRCILFQSTDDFIIVGKPDWSSGEEWRAVDKAPEGVHMIIQGRYWTWMRDLKPSDKRIKK